MIELSLKLNRVAFGAGETVQMDKFSILTRGLIARKGIILSSGEDFGEDMLLLDGESHLTEGLVCARCSIDCVPAVAPLVFTMPTRSCRSNEAPRQASCSDNHVR